MQADTQTEGEGGQRQRQRDKQAMKTEGAGYQRKKVPRLPFPGFLPPHVLPKKIKLKKKKKKRPTVQSERQET